MRKLILPALVFVVLASAASTAQAQRFRRGYSQQQYYYTQPSYGYSTSPYAPMGQGGIVQQALGLDGQSYYGGTLGSGGIVQQVEGQLLNQALGGNTYYNSYPAYSSGYQPYYGSTYSNSYGRRGMGRRW
jgi:hypothetical protein